MFDLYITIATMHIYAYIFQMVEPKLEGFVKRIENVYNIEKYIAIKKTHQNTYI